MPSPKDIKKLMNAAKGAKPASKAADLDEVMGRLPKIDPALQAKIDAELNEIRRRQKAAYDVPQLPKEKGKKALAEARRILAPKEAPAVIVPSKLSNLEKAIRESKGEFGAKRVQQAADEIKNLEDLYTEQALREAFGGDNAKALMVMNPNDFQGFAHPLEMSERRIAGHDPSKATMPTSEYIRHLSGISEFHDVPFLQINKEEQGLPLIPFITGHEGRHRNRAMVERGDPAGLVQLLPRAELREPFPRRDQEEYLEALRKELEMTDNLVIPEKYLAPSDKSSFGDWIYRPAVKLPKLFAEGGQAMAKGGKALKAARGAEKAVESGKDLQSMVEAARPLTAAERAMAGKLMTEYTANQPVTRLSEALGNVGAEGKKLRITQSDRTAAKYLGGPPFSGLQLVDPNYAEARAAWGVKTPTAAKIITNQTSPDILWSTLIGSPFQHRSNELIFDKLYKAFQKSAKEGNLSEELRAKFNAALEPHFGEGADILDPKLRKEINTFEERGIVGDLLLGKELGGALRGGSIIPGGKIMMESTEPMLQGVKTFSVGPRLFTLDKGVISRPDMHPAFPEIMQGEDLRQLFTPVPNEIALPTFHEEFRRRTGGKKKPGYYELTMTPKGDPYPTQDVTEKYLSHLQREGYADGGGVHMQGGGDPGEVSGDMFKPKPLEIPSMFKDAAAALKAKFEKERRSMRKPGAVQDVIMRGPVAFGMGAPMDIVGMGGELLDYAQTKIPALRKPASVMDTGPEKKPTMGYAPRVSLAPEGPYGTEAAQELLGKAGLTTGEERPLFELGAGVISPAVVTGGAKLGKALAPTAREMLEAGLEKAVEPTRMYAAPPSKPGKVKAPANPVGFYNPAEKAALNLQRKQGPGSAFISDMKKLEQGVNDERIAELGLDQLASKPNVTRDEVVALAEQNRIPLRESVRRPYQESDEYSETADALKESIRYREGGIQQVQAELDRVREMSPTSPLVQQYENKIETMRQSIARDRERLEGKKPSLYGPDSHPDYNMPGGENYREIRVSLPSNKRQMSYEDWRKSGSSEEWSSDGTVGTDFMHKTHHGDEPNVLFHLRVADHTDVEGKRGLLIDELQSDWHQAGREFGYKNNFTDQERKRLIDLSVRKSRPYETPLNASELEELQKLTEKDRQNFRGVPKAPFKDNWYQLGLKRAIKEAADNGMDRVYLTTGNRQTLRYTEDQRKGMEHWYDKTYKSFLEKYAKQHGGKLGETKLVVGKEQNTWPAFRDWFESKYPNGVNGRFANAFWPNEGERSVNKYVREFQSALGNKTETVYFIDLTDAMRNSAKKGQSYKAGGAVTMAEGGAVDYESRFNEMLQNHIGMAEGGAVDYESRFNEMLQAHVGMAEGGEVNEYNSDPDMSDSGSYIPAGEYANGGTARLY